MNNEDRQYIVDCLSRGLIKSPCLELGAAFALNARSILEGAGIEHVGTDITPGQDVDFICDFECDDQVSAIGRTFDTVILQNVLEHTFDPVHVLDNACRVVNDGGTVIVTVPAVWPLHDFPMDCYRINPNFFEVYSERRGLRLDQESFRYLQAGKISEFRNGDSSYVYPPLAFGWKHFRSRVVHRLFRTTGRGILFKPHLSIGCVLIKPSL